MKRIGLLGSMLGGAMLQLLAQGGGRKDIGRVASVGPRNRARTAPKFLYLPKGKPSDARYWHDCTQPAQAAVIRAAQAKRDRKAEKLLRDATVSVMNNRAHAFTGQRHNSLYIAK